MAVHVKEKKSGVNFPFQASLALDAVYSELVEDRAFQFLLQNTSDLVFVFNLQKDQMTTVNNSVLQRTDSDISRWAFRRLDETPLAPSLAEAFRSVIQRLHFEYYVVGKTISSPWKKQGTLTLDGINFNGLAILIVKEKVRADDAIASSKKNDDAKTGINFLQTEKMASIGRFASGIAHELRNPLTIISATAQFSLERMELSPALKEHFEAIIRNVTNASRIVNEMLEYAKPRELSLRVDNINDILLRTIDLIKLEISKQKIDLRIRLDNVMPEFYVDSKHLEQTFLNIILNAIRAIQTDGVISVISEFDVVHQSALVKIVDNGEGIRTDIQEKIFDPFFTTRSGGTGLGLSICQNIIHAHGGAIHVESEPGNGATFAISLPVRNLSMTEENNP
ncbi:MAG: two-component system sensor histidine kinase NtrB [Candidatus Zhuqueibacterota bacterium]